MNQPQAGKWVCPKHGDGVNVLNFTAAEKTHSFCFECFLRVMAQFVPQAVFVPEKIVPDEVLDSVKEVQAAIADAAK